MPTRLLPLLLCALALPAASGAGGQDPSPFRLALKSAERSLEVGELESARAFVQRALERDRRSLEAWDLRARWAEAAGDRDELVYSRHQQYRLAVAQKRPRPEARALLEALQALDPMARDLYGMKERFLEKLAPIAKDYEKDERPHSAIRVWKQILALDPESAEAAAAIERIAATPDPSLAADAKPKDLFADVTDEWIQDFDTEHGEWEDRAKLQRENYTTQTDAGYEVLVRTAEAMEQMNAFYRQFFRFGTEEYPGNPSRIFVNIFRNRDEYLTKGIGPPVEWSGGHFTGGAVETYIDTSFEAMVGTLFHEAAHQFVSLATSASGWLNEGLASFFEGTRILPNGTVIMNMPANHRLFPLAQRMERGWMADPQDGFDPSNSDSMPEKAPTFRIVIENKYSWGPPWYAPTWGLVYFLYNYQDPVDGRYVYRDAFMEFVDKSGGRVGEGAARNFEEVVLANPKPPYEGVERAEGGPEIALPETIDAVDAVWKDWITNLRDEQGGIVEASQPWGAWGRYAAANEDYAVAKEHFEKGLVADPGDVELLLEFAALLEEHFDDDDRATKLALEALYFLEQTEPRDDKRIDEVERLLGKLDPKRRTLSRVLDEMATASRATVERYAAAGLDLMVMDVALRAANELKLDDLLVVYTDAVRRTGKSLAIWELAYNEQDLRGWVTGVDAFRPEGTAMGSSFGTFAEDRFDFQFLTLDRVTAGDFSMEAEVEGIKGKVNFCGFVFGQKDATNFHGMLLFPGKTVAEGGAQTGFLDLVTSYGSDIKTWLHVPVDTIPPEDPGRTQAGVWHKLRLDVTGTEVDVWFEGEMVGTKRFATRDVLHGAFGLITGPGTARYKNVRFLARDRDDPASRIERDQRLAKLEAESGGAVGGSYQGKPAPFPAVKRWLRGERSAWDEVGPVPQLLVFWSIQQNDLVRIDRWLADLARQHADVGLEIVCIGSTHDDASLDAYLAEHDFPGAVGVDDLPQGETGIGVSFERFFIRRFNLPRLILIDLDGTVAWEGDPGFQIGFEPTPPYDTFLDDPLDDLILRRKLRLLAAWNRRWEQVVAPALAGGDLAGVLPHLREAQEFDPRYAPEAGRAASALRAVQAAVADLEGSAASIAERGAGPAVEVLAGWAQEHFEIKLGSRQKRALKEATSSRAAKDWKDAVSACKKLAKRKDDEVVERTPALLEELGGLEGELVEGLVEDLTAARDADDWAAFRSALDEVEQRPRRWLCREYFGW